MSDLSQPLLPWTFADQQRTLVGELLLADCERLLDECFAPPTTEDKIQVQMQFWRDDAKRAWLAGTIDFTMKVACHRCFESLDVPMRNDFELCLAENDEIADQISAEHPDFEVLVVGLYEQLSVFDLIEDEILLSLPMIRVHNPRCLAEIDQEFEQIPEKTQPFAQLKNLLPK